MLQNCKILVATSCAGTGLDIRSVRQIVVVGLPYSVEQLLQWAGRLRGDGFISVFTSASHLKENSELSGAIYD
jgi:superfamily II DNA/RNA helicase